MAEAAATGGSRGVMIVRAKLQNNKRVYRDIYVDPLVNLHTVASYVVEAFGFNFDHSFGFSSHRISMARGRVSRIMSSSTI